VYLRVLLKLQAAAAAGAEQPPPTEQALCELMRQAMEALAGVAGGGEEQAAAAAAAAVGGGGGAEGACPDPHPNHIPNPNLRLGLGYYPVTREFINISRYPNLRSHYIGQQTRTSCRDP